MTRNNLIFLLIGLIFTITGAGQTPVQAAGMSDQAITLQGAVHQELTIETEALAEFESQTVQFNDLSRDGTNRGIINYRGVPLRLLLELAGIAKVDKGFSKAVDLAVVVEDSNGRKVTLSWGEIFFRLPGNVLIAYAGSPLQPGHLNCSRCHQKKVYEPRLAVQKRTIDYPKLLITGDRWADRALEGVKKITVVELPPRPGNRKLDPLYAPEVLIVGSVATSVTITALPADLPRQEIKIFPVGQGRLYHGPGETSFSGVAFQDLIARSIQTTNLNTVVMAWAPDGYRSLFSLGELLLGRNADRLLLADRRQGKQLRQNGRFTLVSPSDLMADRWIKAVARIDVITLDLISR
jgi:DMSO/TMAO reductase YedYZ molybdopterin-dependent catalytic subunit